MRFESTILAPARIHDKLGGYIDLMDKIDPKREMIYLAKRRAWSNAFGNPVSLNSIQLKMRSGAHHMSRIETVDDRAKREVIQFFESYGQNRYPWFDDFIQIVNGVRITNFEGYPREDAVHLLDVITPNGAMSFRITRGGEKQPGVALMVEFVKIGMHDVDEIAIIEDENLRQWLLAGLYHALSLRSGHNIMDDVDVKDIAIRYVPDINIGRIERDNKFEALMRSRLAPEDAANAARAMPTNWIRIATGASGASIVTRIRNGSLIHISPHEFEAKSIKQTDGTFSIWIRYRLDNISKQPETPREFAEDAWLKVEAKIKTDFIDSFTAAYNAGVRSQ